MDYLNRQGKYRCLYVNVEVGQYAREEVGRGMRAILGEMVSRAQTFLKDSFPQTIWQSVLNEYGEGAAPKYTLDYVGGAESQAACPAD